MQILPVIFDLKSIFILRNLIFTVIVKTSLFINKVFYYMRLFVLNVFKQKIKIHELTIFEHFY